MNEKNDSALVPRPPGALEKVEPGGKRILAGMVADTLALARVDSNLEQWCLLGESYHFGIGRQSDCGEAVKWFRMAAEKGHARAQCWLAYCCQRASGIKEDMIEGARWFQEAAKQGEITAQYNLAVCFEGGLGVTPDRNEMVRWYEAAANCGHTGAQFRLGVYHATMPRLDSLHANANTNVGLKWLERAAEQGHTKSQLQLGHLHSLPGGQIAEALKWYRTGVESGSDEAQAALGRCFKDGRGVPQDYFEAVKWFRKAAQDGGKDGQYYLGCCYAEGRGVARDTIEAGKWFRQAAEQGRKEAQLEIGKRYERGAGVPQNLDEADRWLRKAAEPEWKHKCGVYDLQTPTQPPRPTGNLGRPRCNRSLRMVVLDDEPLVGEALQMMLRFELPDSFLHTFTSAESALQELEREDPDLFTTDIAHPGMQFPEILDRLADRRGAYPVFVLSAWAESDTAKEMVKRCVAQGWNITLLSKPFLFDDLRRLLRSHLGLDYPELGNLAQ